jgi:hypothetical protein
MPSGSRQLKLQSQSQRRRSAELRFGVQSLVLALLAGLLASGCTERSRDGGGDALPLPAAISNLSTSANFYTLQTAFTPAVLVHSAADSIELFAGLAERGLGAPSFAAWTTMDGPRVFTNGAPAATAPVLRENWLLVWFHGARGWTNGDCPWAVFLQRKPASLRLDDAGLRLQFNGPAGDVVLMPLFGGFLPDDNEQSSQDVASRRMQTREWNKGLPREPLVRLRYWSGVTRALPVACAESVSSDNRTLTFNARFALRRIEDDWQTKPIPLAPLPPFLVPLAMDKELSRRFSRKPFDLDLKPPASPYWGVEGTDTIRVSFPANLALAKSPWPDVDAVVHLETPANGWPEVMFSNEKFFPGAKPTFGQVRLHPGKVPGTPREVPAGPHLRAVIYELP